MGQRLVLRAKDTVTVSELQDFAKRAQEYGLSLKNEVVIQVEDDSLRLVAELPEGVRVVAGKKHIVRPRTKKQVAVEKQIEEHKEKKANGEKAAHVPPAGKKTATKVRKVKCPTCNVRKPVIKQGAITVIKPHTIKGEPCEGGGAQVASKRRTAASASESKK